MHPIWWHNTTMNDEHDTGQLTTPHNHSILIVEDDDRVRRILVKFLGWTGEWNVVGEATDGALAVTLAQQLHPDLILLDLWLPDGNSLHLIPTLHALTPAPRVVMLSADDTEAMQAQARALDVAAYLLKTTPPDELLTNLRTIAGKA
jgi:DNA-binding NarL/FixJ family response regulator